MYSETWFGLDGIKFCEREVYFSYRSTHIQIWTEEKVLFTL